MTHTLVSTPLWQLALLALLVGLPVAAADWPDPDRLPARQELPDPLMTFNGQQVRTRQEWVQKRRPELKALFQHYMYGRLPSPPRIKAEITQQDRHYFQDKATLRQVAISFAGPHVPRIHLLVVLPHTRKPCPVFLGLNFDGNHTILKDPRIVLPDVWMPEFAPGVKDHRATDAGRGKSGRVWPLEYVVGRGYGVATCYCGDIAPDHPGSNDGVFPHFRPKATSQAAPDEWGAIAAWAWGLHRAVDYLLTDPNVDAHGIIVVGHSRLGKAALLAGAFDERIALVIPHQAGCGGTAPSRGKVGESVKQINDRFPHWFDAVFKQFNSAPERLPFDQHCLVALVAPRPVLFTNATDDQWANPAGQFDVLKAADPVYRLFGVEGLAADKMPQENRLIPSRLGYHIRPGKHSMSKQDWQVWLTYVSKYLPPARVSGPSEK